MSNFPPLLRRELGALFLSPALHLVTGGFVLLYSLAFYLMPIREATADFAGVAMFIGFVSVFLAPLITMRSFADEAATGTIELLLTAPVTPGEIVWAKYLASYLFFLTSLLPALAYVAILAYIGDVDRGQTLAALAGLALLGALYVAAGVFASSLTDSQIVAAAGSAATLLGLFIFSSFADPDSGRPDGWGQLSYWTHFQNRLVRGIVQTDDLAYFLCAPALLIFWTWLTVRSRGVFARSRGALRRGPSLLAGLALLAAVESALLGAARLDLTGMGPGELGALWREGRAAAWPLIWPFLLAAGLLALAALAWRYSRAVESGGGFWSGLRRGRALPTLLGGAMAGVIAANLFTLAHLCVREWDVTEAGENTLSVDTRLTLDDLRDRAEITVFLSGEVDYQGVSLLTEVRELLTRYAHYCPRFHATFIDPLREPQRAGSLAAALDIPTQRLSDSLSLSYQGRRLLIPAEALLEEPEAVARMTGDKRYHFRGELPFTLALKRLLDPRQTRVYFTAGRGELRLNESDNRPAAAGRLAAALRREALEIDTLTFGPDAEIPHDCDVLILAGPRLPLGEAAARKLREYLARGGRLLVLLTSAPQEEEAPADADLEALLAGLGGQPRGDLAFDPQRNEGGVASNLLALANPVHPIAAGGPALTCVLPMARSFKEVEPAAGWTSERLLTSSNSAWSQWRHNGKWSRRAGPLVLAFSAAKAAAGEIPEARAVVVGNADFAANLFLDKGYNRAFMISAVQWLAGKDYRVRIDPPASVNRKFRLAGYQLKLIWWLSLVALPQLWLLAGGLIWWVRKQ